MLVRCPKCRTTYKVSDEVLTASSPAFRCSRCKHTFELDAPGVSQASLEADGDTTTPENPAKDAELNLLFEPKTTDPDTADTDKISPKELRPREAEGATHHNDSTDQWSMSDPGREREDDRSFAMPEREQPVDPGKVVDTPQDFADDDKYFPKPDSDDDAADSTNILALSSYIDQRASILPFITLFGLLVIGFTLIAVLSYAHPLASEKLIKQIPLVGSSVLKNEHLKEGIVIQSLRSEYQTIQGNREVFLITGVARNQNPAVVREIRLSGVAYNDEGKELERQSIWVGNTISPKIIRGMTAEDIPHLQNLKPLKSFEIPPGDSIPFTIVLLRSAKNAKQFSCEVMAAEGQV